MRLLLVSQFYPPISGGQERHVENLALALKARGHQVEVATLATGYGRPSGERHTLSLQQGVRVHRFRPTSARLGRLHRDPAERPHLAPLFDPDLSAALEGLLRSQTFDVVHAHDWSVDAVLGPAARHGVPVVFTQHDYSHICATKRLMRGPVVCPGPAVTACALCAGRSYSPLVGPAVAAANLAGRRRRRGAVATFVPVSSSIAQRTGTAALVHEVIPNFVPDALLTGPARQHEDDGSLVFAGDMTHDKGVGTLFAAYRSLADPPPLWMAGRVVDCTPRDVPAGVEVAGPRPHEEVLRRMATARAVVVPSIVLDCSPTVVLEAMALGRPVVASATGGIPDLVDDTTTGLLVPPGDPAALAAALSRVVSDAGLAERLGRAGRRRVESFTASRVVERLEAVYARVAGTGLGSP